MKIVLVAGGSGGHIYPALALAEQLEKRGHDITFIGSNDRMEKDVIPEKGYKYTGLDVYSTRGGALQKLKSLSSIFSAYRKCLKLLKGYDMVIGFGNYISVPVVLAGAKLGLKTILHEQNSYVGRANRILDRKADFIIGSYEENLSQFKNPHIKILGNPQSYKALSVKKDPEVIRSFGLDPEKKTVLIFMGSLGSESVNKVLMEYFKELDGSYQVIYAAGSRYYKQDVSEISDTDYLKIRERVDGVRCMKNCDLLLSRAGATTLAEIMATSTASILIPSPYVPNNHQYKNAMALVSKDAALILEESKLNKDSLRSLVEKTLSDEEGLKRMRENAGKLNNAHVIEDIMDVVEKI